MMYWSRLAAPAQPYKRQQQCDCALYLWGFLILREVSVQIPEGKC